MNTLTIVVQFVLVLAIVFVGALFVDGWLTRRLQKRATDEFLQESRSPYDYERDGL